MAVTRRWAPALLLWAVGCVDPQLDAPGAPCPCADGYVCCATAGWCVPEGDATCPDVLEVTGAAPGGGPLAGGTTLTVLGRGFRPDDRVRVGGVACPLVEAATAERLVCRTPAGRVDAPRADVAVSRDGQDWGVLQEGFRYEVPLLSEVRAHAPVATSARGLLVADLDGDGRPDLYSAHNTDTPDRGVWLRNAGALRFEDVTDAAMTVQVGFASVPVAADFDADGHVDLWVPASVFVPEGERASSILFRGDGSGRFTGEAIRRSQPDGASYDAAAVGDLNGDGRPDLVACLKGDAAVLPDPLHVFWGSAEGLVAAPEVVETLAEPPGRQPGCGDLVVVDLDEDGALEVLAGTDGLRRFEMDGGVLREQPVQDVLQNEHAFRVHALDWDTDGDLDVLLTSRLEEGVRVFRNEGGRLSLVPPLPVEGAPAPVSRVMAGATLDFGMREAVPMDVDLDGDEDLVYPQPGLVRQPRPPEWLEALPDGAWRRRAIPDATAYGGATTATPADLDGDGDLELVGATWHTAPNRQLILRGGARDNPSGAEGPPQVLRVRAQYDGVDMFGASVEVDLDGPDEAPDFAPGAGRRAIRHLDARSPAVAHFGLGDRTEPVWVRARFGGGLEVRVRVTDLSAELVLDACVVTTCE